jgi:hypothetical protein
MSTVLVAFAVTLVICSAFAPLARAAAEPDETPAGAGEWGFRPADSSTPSVNPPAFVWRPQEEAASYDIEVSRDGTFAAVDYRRERIALFCHCPSEEFAAGVWHWRWRYTDADGASSTWSQVREFTVTASAVSMPMPTRSEILSRLPGEHPKLFLRPERLPELREMAGRELSDVYGNLVAKCDRLLAAPPPTAEPPTYPADVERKSEEWRAIWWGNRRYTISALDGAATLAFTWMLGGDERYAALARDILMATAEWDPKGATGYRYNDEAGMPYNYYFSRTYTFLNAFLSEDERGRCRDVMRIRGREMFEHLHPRHIWRPYGSHANRAWHFLGEVTIAFSGEIEEADDWLWFAMNVFYCSYPVWSDDDGGWHEGLAYWRSYLSRFTWWADVMRAAVGVDAYAKPFFGQVGYYAMYLQPPGATRGAFGDLTGHLKSGGNVDIMRVFAGQAGNPYWQWYADAHGEAEAGSTYVDYVRGSQPPPAAKPLDDLPSSKCFWGTGLAMLHTDLTDARNDVFLAFKSSPFGSHSHGYDAQNSFVLYAYGEPLFIRTGRRDVYGSDHHRNWMWETKSVNSILVDGQGQPGRSQAALGRITAFHTSDEVDYVVGDASEAYEGRLTEFTRRVVFLKPDVFLILDTIEAPGPATYQWLLHSPTEMVADDQSAIAATSGSVACEVRMFAPDELRLSQTDVFDPPPRPRVKLTQWHLTAETAAPSARQEFAVSLHPHMRETGPTARIEEAHTDTMRAYRVTWDGAGAVVLWRTSGDGNARAFDVESDGEIAIVRLDADGRPTGAMVDGGALVRFKGVEVAAARPEIGP